MKYSIKSRKYLWVVPIVQIFCSHGHERWWTLMKVRTSDFSDKPTHIWWNGRRLYYLGIHSCLPQKRISEQIASKVIAWVIASLETFNGRKFLVIEAQNCNRNAVENNLILPILGIRRATTVRIDRVTPHLAGWIRVLRPNRKASMLI